MFKKITISSIIIVGSLYACKKDYVCKCTYTNNGNVVTATHDLHTNNVAEADSQCQGFQVSVQGGFTYACGVQ